MQKNVLNFIIIFSISAIILSLIVEQVYKTTKHKNFSNSFKKNNTITKTPPSSNSCKKASTFLKKQTIWHYIQNNSITTGTNSSKLTNTRYSIQFDSKKNTNYSYTILNHNNDTNYIYNCMLSNDVLFPVKLFNDSLLNIKLNAIYTNFLKDFTIAIPYIAPFEIKEKQQVFSAIFFYQNQKKLFEIPVAYTIETINNQKYTYRGIVNIQNTTQKEFAFIPDNILNSIQISGSSSIFGIEEFKIILTYKSSQIVSSIKRISNTTSK